MADDGREQRLREVMYFQYNVRNDADLPAALWRRMPKRPLVTQLALRKIRYIQLVTQAQRDAMERQLPIEERVEWVACLETIPEIDGFAIKLLDTEPLEEMLLSVGHEVGHTHFVNLSHPRLARVANASCRPPIGFEEETCEEFARLWIYWGKRNRAVLKANLEVLRTSHQRLWLIKL